MEELSLFDENGNLQIMELINDEFENITDEYSKYEKIYLEELENVPIDNFENLKPLSSCFNIPKARRLIVLVQRYFRKHLVL